MWNPAPLSYHPGLIGAAAKCLETTYLLNKSSLPRRPPGFALSHQPCMSTTPTPSIRPRATTPEREGTLRACSWTVFHTGTHDCSTVHLQRSFDGRLPISHRLFQY